MERTVPVELGQRSYQVRVGAGLLAELGPAVAAAAAGATSVVVVTDSTVAGLHAKAAVESLEAVLPAVAVIDFPAGEANKTLATVSHVLDKVFAVRPAIDRSTVIVTVGGGVVGDLGGFVAAVALRGVRFFQCPTTLLADVDASVGGKTGVDHPAGKNLIGAFHQPAGVLIDVATLKTLPAAELSGGLAECVKHAVIRDATLLDFLEDHAADVLACREELMTELVARNVEIKAAVVSADEREAGERAHLNFGHTIGHAVEAFAGYGDLGHGQAVALGMVAACRIAVSRGLLEQDSAERVEGLLARLRLPVRRPGLNAEAIWQVMLHDKKTHGGQVRMVLPVMLGAAAMFDDITPQSVRDALEYLGK